MAIEYDILTDLKLVIARVYDEITDQQIMENFERLKQMDGFDPSFVQISDCRYITQNNTSYNGLRTTGQATPFHRDAKRVFLIARAIERGRGNQYGIHATESSDAFFMTEKLEDGLKWLGLEEYKDRIEPLMHKPKESVSD